MVEIAYHNKRPLYKGLGANSLLWLLTHSKAGFFMRLAAKPLTAAKNTKGAQKFCWGRK
ncbi:MAG: hypothetical protein QMD09_03255 [Desulfatibacillaceae bacterium]|nr:hypothetical protein [Desulfatibacillaceae bacterium]